jgi:predicted peroxiredoxin
MDGRNPAVRRAGTRARALHLSRGMADKLVILLAHGANDDKSSVAFTIANAALSTGMQVAVFLTSDGVELARDGSCDMTLVQPFRKLDELIEDFTGKGGIVWACTPCYKHRGLDDAKNYEKVLVTGAGPLVEWVKGGAATISL